jgi:hypothetical protein
LCLIWVFIAQTSIPGGIYICISEKERKMNLRQREIAQGS